MKYTSKSFTVGPPGTEAYRENYERIFGRPEPKPEAPCSTPHCQGHFWDEWGFKLCKVPLPATVEYTPDQWCRAHNRPCGALGGCPLADPQS